MPRAIRIHEHGGPEVLRWEEAPSADPGPGEISVRQRAAGLNFIDVYHRTGLYPPPSLPVTLGSEGAGDVIGAGEGVTEFSVGDRIAYAGSFGAYAEERLLPADRAVPIPAGITYETAAAMMLKGMTARYLLRETYEVGPETTLLFHAAAGGVGLIACQWAASLGATVIGTVSSDGKARLAQANGCAHAVNVKTENVVERVREITEGRGCDVVYDSVGRDTFPASLDCLKPRGLWVSFGNSSGPVDAFPVGLLAAKGSLYATRPALVTYTAKRDDLLANASDLFGVVASGKVRIAIGQRHALKDAAEAHRDLEARKTTGSTVLEI